MSFKILDDLYTTEDALRLEEELDLLKNSIYKKVNKESFLEILRTKVTKSTCDELTELMSGSFENTDLINSQIDNLILELKKIPVVTIKIGFEPSYAQITNISMHASSLHGKKVIVDIFFDPQIISGAEIIYDGKFYNGTTNNAFNLALESQTKSVPREGDFLIGRLK